MTANDFVFWFSGYVSAIGDRVKVPNEQDWVRIRAALDKVNVNELIGYQTILS